MPNLYGVDRRCDARTLDWIQQALAKGIPILGICRGAQMLNIVHDGNLTPDLGPDTRHHGRDGGPFCVEHVVAIDPGD